MNTAKTIKRLRPSQKRRHGQCKRRDRADHLVDDAVGAQRRGDRQRNADQERQNHGVEGERMPSPAAARARPPGPAGDRPCDVPSCPSTTSPRKMANWAQSGWSRPEVGAQGCQRLRSGVGAEHDRRGIAGDHPDEQEHDHHDAEQDRQQLDQPVHDEAREIHVIPLLRYGSPAALPLLGGKAADLLPHFVRQTSERRIRRVG